MKIRLEVLAGIVDAFGFYKQTYYEVWLKDSEFVKQIIYLCRSIGLNCYKYYYENYACWKIELYGPVLSEIPVRHIEHVTPLQTNCDPLCHSIRVEKNR